MTATDVATLVGSLRRGSINRRLAESLAGFAPAEISPSIVEIRQLPLYDQDLDDSPPLEWNAFRQRIKAADAVLFVTPEYNRSVPGALKNALDVGSRPYGQSVWRGKPCAVISASPGSIGAFGANHHLRQCLVYLDMPTMAQPEAYIGHADRLWGPDGAIAEESTREFLRGFMRAFAGWIATNARARQGA